ncbi:MAG: vitamin K epoxide reductase family protein [Armatimonadetes bacterium]|nr:vitamin K epoxide reductase family protein [Armatimonadota bacterium]
MGDVKRTGTASSDPQNSPEDRQDNGVSLNQRVLWPHYINLIWGVWLIASPVTFGYESAALTWSDMISGALVLLLTGITLLWKQWWAPWGTGIVGFWLLFAPLVFWAPSAGIYANDTLMGLLVVGFALLAPGVPGIPERPGPTTPPGWSYNPSSFPQRGPIIGLALCSYFISRYLSAYQLGYIDTVWEPFFGNGTRTVLESDVSKAFPVSDAGLGAVSYIFDALAGFFGNTRRWRTMPWMVILFGILIIPIGVVSIVLVILQPVAVGAWCTLCLATAAIMLMMIPPSVDEIFATIEYLVLAKREGQSLWKVFWVGGTLENQGKATEEVKKPSKEMLKPVNILLSQPWHLYLIALLGVWLLASPQILGVQGNAATSNHIMGALVASFAFIALSEPARAMRFAQVLFGLWIIASPWLLGGASGWGLWNNALVGAALIPLCIPRGKIHQSYGMWNRYII